MSHVSVWHPEKLILTLQRARTSLSLPQIIFVNGKHILIDGNTQKETRTSNKKSTFFMSHTDALYHSEENPPTEDFRWKYFDWISLENLYTLRISQSDNTINIMEASWTLRKDLKGGSAGLMIIIHNYHEMCVRKIKK